MFLGTGAGLLWGQLEGRYECDGVSNKWQGNVISVSKNWGRSVGLQQELGQECEGVSKKWGRSVWGQEEVVNLCGVVSKRLGWDLRGSAGRGKFVIRSAISGAGF